MNSSKEVWKNIVNTLKIEKILRFAQDDNPLSMQRKSIIKPLFLVLSSKPGWNLPDKLSFSQC